MLAQGEAKEQNQPGPDGPQPASPSQGVMAGWEDWRTRTVTETEPVPERKLGGCLSSRQESRGSPCEKEGHKQETNLIITQRHLPYARPRLSPTETSEESLPPMALESAPGKLQAPQLS